MMTLPRGQGRPDRGGDAAMRDCRVRMAFLGLILSLPLLINAVVPGGTGPAGDGPPRHERRPLLALMPSDPTAPVYQVELVLVAGLMVAGQQRRRLATSRGSRSRD